MTIDRATQAVEYAADVLARHAVRWLGGHRYDQCTCGWAGDEHGRLDLADASRNLKVGDRIEFIPPHCDPTVNLYDHLHVLRGDRVEGVWTIAARGKSQ